MNSRVRALIWEELRVGGVIVAACLVLGLLWMLRLRLAYSATMRHEDMLEVARMIVAWLPVACAVLLVLNIRNSGHLGGGFSRRILRMPVETSAAVTVALLVRLLEVMALGAVLFLAQRLLFGQLPNWRLVFAAGTLYLLVQTADWARALAEALVFLLAAALAAWLLQSTGRWVWLFDFLDVADTLDTAVVLAGFAGLVSLCLVASLFTVDRTRKGWRIALSQGATVGELLGWRNAGTDTPFASPQAAQCWYEMRRTRLLMPLATVFLWLFGTGLYGVYLGVEQSTAGEAAGTRFSRWLLDPVVTDLMPLAALLLAAGIWRMQASWLGWRENRRSASGWTARNPVTKAQAARARLAVAGLNLAMALGMAAALHLATLLLCDQHALVRLFRDAWSAGAVNAREITVILLGPVLLAGLVAWIIMQMPAFVPVCLMAVPLAGMLYGFFWSEFALACDFQLHHWMKRDTAYAFALTVMLLCPTVYYLTSLAATCWLGWVRRWSALLSLALWLGLARALFPANAGFEGERHTQAVLLCLAVAALAVICWPETMLRAAGGLRVALRRQSRAHHARGAAFTPVGRRLSHAALLLSCCALVAWMRWPADPAAHAAMRARGVPATLSELNDAYQPVPAERNLADKYMKTMHAERPLENAWRNAQGAVLRNQYDRANGDIWRNILVQGGAEVRRTEQIPRDVWSATTEYWRMVGLPMSERLHAVAALGLTQSRYPVELRQGFGTLLGHLAPLRRMARFLALEGWVAAVEQRPRDAASSVLDTLPIANSLRDEPILISQLVREAIIGIACGSLETILNRCELPDTELVRLQNGLAAALPPGKDEFFMERAIAGEECFFVSGTLRPDSFLDYSESGRPGMLFDAPARQAFASMMEVAGVGCLDRAIAVLHFERLIAAGRAAARNGTLPEAPQLEPQLADRLYYCAPLVHMSLSSSGRWLESEWRGRTQLDMARTALAVERSRLANGHLPEHLEELVPAYLDRVPKDPWNHDKPLSYRIKQNGAFVLYTWGQNRTDEHGEEMRNWWSKGDMTFTVAPPDLRNRPQVADAPVPTQGVGT